ncbi:hypothetical protein DSM106972_086920 [Dulcicalothrix desertica PCC 7102]|uniref:Uncharacterized protein n=1 Tax=Dulcicalothrix desertica PCC 7102 TaxID=232991 RepID=A0A433US83_9CYAN|nr:hypothetical protein [Dulcicalothrix desertica]RUS96669.1 hypothetical protein DSM106972_086920 [Dulcicalothrix desertica PCC 7102]TWH54859.1 hypothetical protein CAL7102_02934 [Dulcicalothrix desertica PCC 7102]
MAYSDFTLHKVRDAFQLVINEKSNLFPDSPSSEPSEILKLLLEEYIQLATAINTEKARSELLIAQILTEVRRQLKYRISLFSGTDFNVDPSKGLNGFCDFILSASEEQFEIEAPVIIVIEAKNESLKSGLGQCIATMEGARLFNQKADKQVKKIYGAVTSGTNWRFLILEENKVFIDNRVILICRCATVYNYWRDLHKNQR